jgi:AraC-like DNA-binding protein
MKEITNKTVSLMEIRDLDINSVTPDLISYKKDLIHDIVEKKLKKLFLEKKFDRTVYLTANFIKQNQGLKSIDDVAYKIGVSRRHLERKFINSVGISPKLYSRIIRFHYANKMLNTINVDSLISIALDSGYYDQAHFCRDYKKFSGTTPSRNKSLSHFYNNIFNL